jgi:hypothetical protein
MTSTAKQDSPSLHDPATMPTDISGRLSAFDKFATHRNGTSAPIVAQGQMSNVNIPDQGDYVRPQWGIYRSVHSAKSDILDTYLLFRNYTASKA